jgi:hypothetical protein
MKRKWKKRLPSKVHYRVDGNGLVWWKLSNGQETESLTEVFADVRERVLAWKS